MTNLYELQASLTLDSDGYTAEIDKTREQTEKLGEEIDKTSKETDPLSEGLGDIPTGEPQAQGWSIMGEVMGNIVTQGIMSALNAMKQFVVDTVQAGEAFESSMASVQAITGASDEELESLSETAREAGESTVFSASEAADALGYMALAGWDAEESASGLNGVLNLAAASGMDLAEASDMVTDYLSAFGMEASESAYFADMLATAQSSSNTTAEMLGEAYKNCAANLHGAGQSAQTVTSLLEGMANQGLKGSEAGTALSAVMRDITNSMEDGSIMIGDTAVSVADADGNFRDLNDILTDVEAATEGMGTAEETAALGATFTSDSIKGLNTILGEGMDSINGYKDALGDCDGAAEDMADTMNDTLAGDIKTMQSHLESLELNLYDMFEPALRGGVDALTMLIDGLSQTTGVIGECITEYNNYKNGVEEVVVSEDDLSVAMNYAQYMTAEQRAALQNYSNTAAEAETQSDDTADAVEGTGDAMDEASGEWVLGVNTMTDEWSDLQSEIEAGAQDIRGSLQQMWTDANEDEVVGLEDFVANLNNQTANLQQWTEDMAAIGQMASQGMIDEGLLAELEAAGPESAELVHEIATADEGELESLESAWQENAAACTDAYITELGGSEDDINAYWDGIAENASGSGTETGENYASGTAEGIENGSADVESASEEMMQGAIDRANDVAGIASPSKVMAESGKYLAQGVERGLKDGQSGLKSTMGAVMRSTIQTARSSVSGTNSVGAYMVQGIISGVNSQSGTLYSTMRRLIKNAVQAARDAGEIASPSKLFAREVGQWIPAGIGSGIESGAGDLQRTMEDTIDSLTGYVPNGTLRTTRNGEYTSGNFITGIDMVLTDSAGTVFARTAKDSLNTINGQSLRFAQRGLAGY